MSTASRKVSGAESVLTPVINEHHSSVEVDVRDTVVKVLFGTYIANKLWYLNRRLWFVITVSLIATSIAGMIGSVTEGRVGEVLCATQALAFPSLVFEFMHLNATLLKCIVTYFEWWYVQCTLTFTAIVACDIVGWSPGRVMFMVSSYIFLTITLASDARSYRHSRFRMLWIFLSLGSLLYCFALSVFSLWANQHVRVINVFDVEWRTNEMLVASLSTLIIFYTKAMYLVVLYPDHFTIITARVLNPIMIHHDSVDEQQSSVSSSSSSSSPPPPPPSSEVLVVQSEKSLAPAGFSSGSRIRIRDTLARRLFSRPTAIRVWRMYRSTWHVSSLVVFTTFVCGIVGLSVRGSVGNVLCSLSLLTPPTIALDVLMDNVNVINNLVRTFEFWYLLMNHVVCTIALCDLFAWTGWRPVFVCVAMTYSLCIPMIIDAWRFKTWYARLVTLLVFWLFVMILGVFLHFSTTLAERHTRSVRVFDLQYRNDEVASGALLTLFVFNTKGLVNLWRWADCFFVIHSRVLNPVILYHKRKAAGAAEAEAAVRLETVSENDADDVSDIYK